jgi:hypothetical protein
MQDPGKWCKNGTRDFSRRIAPRDADASRVVPAPVLGQ